MSHKWGPNQRTPSRVPLKCIQSDVVPLSTNRHGSSHWVYQPSRLVRGVFCRTGPQMTCNSATFKAFSRLMLVSMEKRVDKDDLGMLRKITLGLEPTIVKAASPKNWRFSKSLEETGELHVDWSYLSSWFDHLFVLNFISNQLKTSWL